MYGRGRGYQSGLGIGPPVTPPIIKQLLIANVVVFLCQSLFPVFTTFGAAQPALFWQAGYLWQPFTYMFLHGNLPHIAMNMFSLWMFGSPLVMVWGPRRFLRYYLLCGVGAGLVIVSLPYLQVWAGMRDLGVLLGPTVGASGAVFGVVLAYSLTWPDRTIMLLFPPVAFRAIWLIPALFAMEWMLGPSNVSHEGHLGGVLAGWLLLRNHTDARLPTLDQVRYRWRRYRMRQKLRAVRSEDARNDWHDDARSKPLSRRTDDEDRTIH